MKNAKPAYCARGAPRRPARYAAGGFRFGISTRGYYVFRILRTKPKDASS